MMGRKRVTQIFPFLLPARILQRKILFYVGLALDRNRYARTLSETRLPCAVYETGSALYNGDTGFDMIYQQNKVFNLKLAAQRLNGLMICPGETFSFWYALHKAQRSVAYKEGLVVRDGVLTTALGGGLCQMSCLLFLLFLHTPLTVVERTGHDVKDFPTEQAGEPPGTDATVSEGWLDLKAKNETGITFQIGIDFDEQKITGGIYTSVQLPFWYEIAGCDLSYFRQNRKVFQTVAVVRRKIDRKTGEMISEERLYEDLCEIGYPLSADIPITEKGDAHFMEKKKVAVLFGGHSPEHEISLQSAHAVITHMDEARYEPIPIGITREGEWFHFTGSTDKILDDSWCNSSDCTPAMISPSHELHGLMEFDGQQVRQLRLDAALPVLHGRYGEDGTVQGLLEIAGIPVVGCGTLSSALCMDKERAQKMVRLAGIQVPGSLVFPRGTDLEQIVRQAEDLGYPQYVKPVRGGSSIGITKITGKEQLPDALTLAFEYDDHVMLEQNVPGIEVGCAVLGDESPIVSEPDETEFDDGFFDNNGFLDYREKYNPKKSVVHVPARLSEKTVEESKETALNIYQALGCSGFARVDLFLTPSGEIVFNEVNTIPGFTIHSRYAKMMETAGLSFDQVISTVIDLAIGA